VYGPHLRTASALASMSVLLCTLTAAWCFSPLQAAESNLLACGILGLYVFVFLMFALCASYTIWKVIAHLIYIVKFPNFSHFRTRKTCNLHDSHKNTTYRAFAYTIWKTGDYQLEEASDPAER